MTSCNPQVSAAPVTPEIEWRELSRYLDGMLELEGDVREAWLTDLGARAPAVAMRLRRYEVELAQIHQERFLDGNPVVPMAPSPLAGQNLGAYTLQRPIGHGGMGTVWLAHRNDGRFEGRAAIKLLNVALLGHPAEQRFAREGSVLAQLQHPNIAHLTDAGVAAGGQPYLVLEYIEGERIDQYCETHDLSVERRIALFLDVLAAVAHAHSRLIVHRDLKPSNILVTADGVVKLLDFGVAALLRPTDDTQLTREAAAGLTPEYAAPEQLLGQSVTTATDVYALGLVLFVLLAGRHPTPPEHRTTAEMLRQTLEGEAPRASQVAVSAGRGRVLRGDLDNIIAMALRKEPDERYSTVELFAQDLRRYLALEPVSARPTTLGYRAGKFVRRHRGGVLSALAVTVALVGAVVVTTQQMFEARRQSEAAVASARRAEATKDFLQRVLSEFQMRGVPLTARALLERSSAMLKAQYGDQPQFVAEMLIELSREYGDLLEVNTSMDMLADAGEIAQQMGNYLLLANAECSMGRMESRKQNFEAIEPHLIKATEALAHVGSPDLEVQVRCLNARAELLAAHNDRVGAIDLQRQSRDMLERAGATHGSLYNTVLAGLGTDLMDEGRVTEALPIYRLSLDMHRRYGRGGTRMEAIAQQNVAAALYRLGEVRESGDLSRQLFERYAQLQAPEDISAMFLVNTAISANRLARRDPVLDLLPAAVERSEKAGDMYTFRLGSFALAQARLQGGSSHDDVEAPLLHLEAAHEGKEIPAATRVLIEGVRTEQMLAEGHTAEAYRRALKLLTDIGYPRQEKPRPVYLALLLVGRAALSAGEAESAEKHAREALAIMEPIARGSDTSADVGEALLVLGDALHDLGRKDEAKVQLTRAVQSLGNGYGFDHPRTRDARTLLAALN